MFVPIVPGNDGSGHGFPFFFPSVWAVTEREEMLRKYFKKLLLIRLHLILTNPESGRACCESLRGPITEAFEAADDT